MKLVVRFCALFATLLTIAACSGESKLPVATGKGSISAINTIVSSPQIGVLIEQRPLAAVDFGKSTPASPFDDLDYTFNFSVQLAPGADLTRVASTELSVVKDTAYTFVISGSLASPDITLWQSPITVFAAGTTNADVQFGHTSPATGDYDVYLLDAATAPALGNESASLSFGEVTPSVDVAAGDYVLTLTAPGDPASVIYQSQPFTITAGTPYLITAFDATPNELTPVLVRMFNRASGAVQPVLPAGVPGKIRLLHAAFDTGGVDIYFDDPLTTPVITNQVFGDVSAEYDAPDNPFPLTYTQTGNIGNILIDQDPTVPLGTRADIILVDTGGSTPALLANIPDRRGIATGAIVSLQNVALIDDIIDLYAVPTGETIDDATPKVVFQLFGTAPTRFILAAGVYDLYVTVTATKTILAGPVTVDLAAGDVVETMVYENADPAVVDLVIIPPP